MTKAEFVGKLAEKGKITKKLAKEAIELVFSTIGEALVNGDEIAVPCFGKFSVVVRKSAIRLKPTHQGKTQHPGNQSRKVYSRKGPQRIHKVILVLRGCR